MNPVISMAAILGALGMLLVGARLLQLLGWAGNETGRKLVHMGMGGISLALPWLFTSARPVWTLALLSVAALVIVRFVPIAAKWIGGALYDVERFSFGEIYYPLGVALAFTLARENPAVYCAAIGVLAFADSAGALVGSRWGHRRFSVFGHWKSIEGSAAVLVTSVLCVALSFVAFGGESWMSALAVGLLVGAAATVVEAAAGHGVDNLVLPLAVVGLLKAWGGEIADLPGIRLMLGAAVAALFTGSVIVACILVHRSRPASRNVASSR